MNRQIKFRVWFPGINLMGSVTNLKGSNDGFLFDGVVAECWPNGKQQFYEAYKNFTLMQYTGLKDKNGKEIYEGDVVNGYSFNGSTYALGSVVWWTGGWWVEPLQSIEGSTELYGEHIHAEIIGNIYENPDLLNSA